MAANNNSNGSILDFGMLTQQQIGIVSEVISAFRLKVTANPNSSLGLCTPEFSSDFESRLVLYHALNDDAMKKKAFEFAFAQACRASGRQATVSENPVISGADVVVDNQRFSCKTEASSSIKSDNITISKLMEARWIRNCYSGEDFQKGIISNVIPHLHRYERIILLRAFRRGDHYEYRLIEIPRELLLSMQNVQAHQFSVRTQNGSTSVQVDCGHNKTFLLRLDGSVEKVTINGLPESLCSSHGTWTVPIRLTQNASSV